MLGDLRSLLTDLFRSWWARIGVLNGVVSYTGRIVDLGPINPYVGPVFICAGSVCLGISILRVYHEQKCEIRRLQGLLSDRGEMTTILIDKLRGEVQNNIEHLDHAAMLHDDAWQAITPDDLKSLPREIRNLGSNFYTELRSLKGLMDTPDHRESAMRRRQDTREKVALNGQALCSALAKHVES